MHINNFLRKLGGFSAALLLLAGITFFSATETQAQRRVGRRVVIVRPVSPFRAYRPFGWRNYGWYNTGWYDNTWYNPYSQYIFDNSSEAAEEGYEEGFDRGEEDGRKQKKFDFEKSSRYRDAGFGNFGEVYRKNFARGYQGGYEAGVAKAAVKAREKAAKEAEKLAKKAAKEAEKAARRSSRDAD